MNAKALIRDLAAGSLAALKAFDVILGRNNRWLILTFHRVLPADLRGEYPLPHLAVTPEELSWIIDTLTPIFEIKPVSEAASVWREQNNFSPMLSITFDDGQWDNLHYALPVLETKGVKATFYLPTDFISGDHMLWHDQAAFAWQLLRNNEQARQSAMKDHAALIHKAMALSSAHEFVRSLKDVEPGERYSTVASLLEFVGSDMDWARIMTWEEAEKIKLAGHEIGSHGRSHNLLPQQSEQGQLQELEGSRAAIVSQMGINPQSFCYPNGDYDDRTLEVIQTCDYDNAVTTQWGINGRDQSGFELLRCDMNPFLLTDRHGELSTSRLKMRLAGFLGGAAR